MKLVKFTRPDGSPVWINPEAIVFVEVREGNDSKTLIRDNLGIHYVMEPPEEVVKMLCSPGWSIY